MPKIYDDSDNPNAFHGTHCAAMRIVADKVGQELKAKGLDDGLDVCAHHGALKSVAEIVATNAAHPQRAVQQRVSG